MANGHGGARPGAGRRHGALSKAKKEIAEAAKEHAEDALQVLVDLAKDVSVPASSRVSAAEAIINRAYGRPFQTNNNNNTHELSDPMKELFDKVAQNSGRIGKP